MDADDWAPVCAFLASGDVQGFVDWAGASLSAKKANFRQLGSGLRQHCLDKVPPADAAGFLAACLELLLSVPCSQQQGPSAGSASSTAAGAGGSGCAAGTEASAQGAASGPQPCRQQQRLTGAGGAGGSGAARGKEDSSRQPPPVQYLCLDLAAEYMRRLPPDSSRSSSPDDSSSSHPGGEDGGAASRSPSAPEPSHRSELRARGAALLMTLVLSEQEATATAVAILDEDDLAVVDGGGNDGSGGGGDDGAGAGAARVAAKLSQAFGLRLSDVGGCTERGAEVLAAYVRRILRGSSTGSPAVALLVQMPELEQRYEGLTQRLDVGEALQALLAAGQEQAALEWVTGLQQEHQVTYVELCIAGDRLGPAARAVRAFGLGDLFPGVEARYAAARLERMIEKRLWEPAAQLVGDDPALQEELVATMAALGEPDVACQYAAQWGLAASAAAATPQALAADEARRRETYLQLDLTGGALLLIDHPSQLPSAAALLAGADVIGFDVEWRPCADKKVDRKAAKGARGAGQSGTFLTAAGQNDGSGGGGGSPASVLQVACRRGVAVFDLIALAGGKDPQAVLELDACLAGIFGRGASVPKLGFDVRGDLAKLVSSWPALGSLRTVPGVLDLQACAGLLGLPPVTKRAGLGLSRMCEAVLGRPLDKSMRLSNWELRPLSERQLRYAALDALALVRLYEALPWAEQAQPGELAAMLRGLAFDHDRRPAAQRRQQVVQQARQVGTPEPQQMHGADRSGVASAGACGEQQQGQGQQLQQAGRPVAGSSSDGDRGPVASSASGAAAPLGGGNSGGSDGNGRGEGRPSLASHVARGALQQQQQGDRECRPGSARRGGGGVPHHEQSRCPSTPALLLLRRLPPARLLLLHRERRPSPPPPLPLQRGGRQPRRGGGVDASQGAGGGWGRRLRVAHAPTARAWRASAVVAAALLASRL